MNFALSEYSLNAKKGIGYFQNFTIFWNLFGYFWVFFGNLGGECFWRNFFERIFWEDFFRRNHLGGILWEELLSRN